MSTSTLSPVLDHNGRPVRVVAGSFFEVADFRGRYVAISAPGVDTPAGAVQWFVDSRCCNYDTPHVISQAWRAAGCPTRAEWDALQ